MASIILKLKMAFISDFLILIISSGLFYVSFSNPICPMEFPGHPPLAVYKEDVELLQFSLNLEFLEAEFFSWSANGYGLDVTAPQLVMGGPPPIGGQKANLDFVTHNIINEFANQEIGHIRAIFYTVGGFPRPLMDISAENFAKFFDEAFGYKLEPPFDPYRDSLSYMLSCYVLPYVGLNGYVAANPFINGYKSKRVLAGLLGPEAGQDAVCRTYLYERAAQIVFPYPYTVAEFTARISGLRNRLGMCGIKDEGLFVPPQLGAENRTTSNILSADYFSLSYPRTPAEILRIVYDTGNEHVPGGFFPAGANGKIARDFLKQPWNKEKTH